jgi:hypothetical protein
MFHPLPVYIGLRYVRTRRRGGEPMFVDPFEGRADLQKGIVKAVGDPEERMREDRLRALRAMRFAARFGFEIDPATWQAITHSAPHLGRLSAEQFLDAEHSGTANLVAAQCSVSVTRIRIA